MLVFSNERHIIHVLISLLFQMPWHRCFGIVSLRYGNPSNPSMNFSSLLDNNRLKWPGSILWDLWSTLVMVFNSCMAHTENHNGKVQGIHNHKLGTAVSGGIQAWGMPYSWLPLSPAHCGGRQRLRRTTGRR